jgi:hypothetical protein
MKHTWGMQNACNNLVEKLEGKILLGRFRCNGRILLK